MFTRVLVANRGEIAVRIQQTLRVMGIETVAVYSDPDAGAPHVMLADYAYPIQGNTAEETYLDMDKIIAVARQGGAQAAHPGYGFLSENPDFARACQGAGLVFIGPTPESLEALGDKVQSKELAQRAGVPTVPGSPVLNADNQGQAEQFLEEWGVPALVKAAAGGGGRGMRLVQKPEELAAALEAARREAQASFGDDRVFLERYVTYPRHIEFQILADQYGNTIHLLERECSIQRRHQKMIEETPSPALTPELRQQMGQAAVRLAQAAGYVNAGTVEFLLDTPRNQFYFLEMNPRLQVEHPITETILGIDLVAWQVRIAAGEPLSLAQVDVQPRGHAIECRIYAEDPYNGFLPTAGPLRYWRPPSGPGLRLDSGVQAGQEVSMYYDPLLAKLIASGPDRSLCLRRMAEALRNFAALGIITNTPFLWRVATHPRFQAGDYNTHFLADHPELLTPAERPDLSLVAPALAAWTFSQPVAEGTPRGRLAHFDTTPRQSGHPWRLP